MTSPSKRGDVGRRVLFLVLAIFVYRLGAHIPVPGVNINEVARVFESSGAGDLLSLFNVFSGGALARVTIFALGVVPYISSSIVMQLAGEVFPTIKQLKKEGEVGRRKVSQYTRYLALILGMFQAMGLASLLSSQPGVVAFNAVQFYISTTVVLVSGTMFLVWLGDQISERGVGNGMSLIICAGIASSLPPSFGKMLTLVGQNALPIPLVVFFFIMLVGMVLFVVFVERAQRKVPISYAKRQVGRQILQAQSTHLPLKLNMAGVIPPIFASSIIAFPATIFSLLGQFPAFSFLKDGAVHLRAGQPIYVALYALAIVFFCYFYTALVYSPKETAENLKKSGAFVPGIRPGEQTSFYLEKIILRLTFLGAVYITFVCLLPELILLKWSALPFYFGGTSLLIMVVVAMDLMTQLQSHLLSYQYESLLKQANFSGKRS
jgi:preprotein translocase subunit SecY